MLMDRIEPAIEKSIDDYILNTNDTQQRFMDILEGLNKRFIGNPEFIELEDLFHLNSAVAIRHSYKLGFRDAMGHYKK